MGGAMQVGAMGPAVPLLSATGSAKLKVLIVGDGYTASQLPTLFWPQARLLAEAVAASNWFKAAPFVSIWGIPVASSVPGASIAASCNEGVPLAVATYFGAEFGRGGLCRLLEGNDDLVTAVHDAAVGLDDCNVKIVLVNAPRRGGACGSDVLWVSTGPMDWVKVALHELGHVFNLADEYDYWVGCNRESGQDVGTAGTSCLNISLDGEYPLWRAKGLTPAAATWPTKENKTPARCDRSTSGQPADTIGSFEGANHFHAGYFRPSYSCRMRKSKNNFCQICDLAIEEWLRQ
jgi:hypothetical protein